MKTAAISHTFVPKRNKFPFEITVIAYGTPVLLRDTTLNILKAYRVPCHKITVFVRTLEEHGLYTNCLIPGTYGRIVATGSASIPELYNWIQKYYMLGTPVVVLKDCIQGLYQQIGSCIQPLRSLLGLCTLGFSECTKHHTTLWGLSPSREDMTTTVSVGLQLLVGSVWGFIASGPKFHLTHHGVEDYERSILAYIQEGTCVRLSMATAIECKVSKSSLKYSIALYKLAQKYPMFVKYTEEGLLQFRI